MQERIKFNEKVGLHTLIRIGVQHQILKLFRIGEEFPAASHHRDIQASEFRQLPFRLLLQLLHQEIQLERRGHELPVFAELMYLEHRHDILNEARLRDLVHRYGGHLKLLSAHPAPLAVKDNELSVRPTPVDSKRD